MNWASLHTHSICDGLAGDYAHVRWSAYETKDRFEGATLVCLFVRPVRATFGEAMQ